MYTVFVLMCGTHIFLWRNEEFRDWLTDCICVCVSARARACECAYIRTHLRESVFLCPCVRSPACKRSHPMLLFFRLNYSIGLYIATHNWPNSSVGAVSGCRRVHAIVSVTIFNSVVQNAFCKFHWYTMFFYYIFFITVIAKRIYSEERHHNINAKKINQSVM